MAANEKTAKVSHYQVLKRPVVTEKSASWLPERSVAFVVEKGSSKSQIREAVEHVFSVEVESVRTMNVLGKVKRSRNGLGRRASFKKAYITLKPGFSVDLVEGL